MQKLAILLLSAITLFSCEEPIEIETENGDKQLAIDAFINNLPQKQVIILKMSKAFFGNEQQVPVTGATVQVSDSDGKLYVFTDVNNNGEYVWNDSVLVHSGKNYFLQIQYNNQTYTSTSLANPAPVIDSLVVTEAGGFFGGGEGYFAEYFASDLPGREDYYRIRTYRNDVLDSRKNGIVLSIDGAFGAGNDGLQFIFPIRAGINDQEIPFKAGEKIKVELTSINKEVYSFFNQVSNQINNGGLFAVPPSNVRTNIVSSSTVPAQKAVGMFSVSMVNSIEKVVE